jgi:hypothetical protein
MPELMKVKGYCFRYTEITGLSENGIEKGKLRLMKVKLIGKSQDFRDYIEGKWNSINIVF